MTRDSPVNVYSLFRSLYYPQYIIRPLVSIFWAHWMRLCTIFRHCILQDALRVAPNHHKFPHAAWSWLNTNYIGRCIEMPPCEVPPSGEIELCIAQSMRRFPTALRQFAIFNVISLQDTFLISLLLKLSHWIVHCIFNCLIPVFQPGPWCRLLLRTPYHSRDFDCAKELSQAFRDSAVVQLICSAVSANTSELGSDWKMVINLSSAFCSPDATSLDLQICCP